VTGERHLVARQVLELHVSPLTDAPALSDAVSALHARELAAVVERCLDEVCPPGARVRLDTVHVDLGSIDGAALATEFPRLLEERLRTALSSALRRGRLDATPVGSRHGDLEAVDMFARLGVLPWWADHTEPSAVADAFARGVHADPHAVGLLLRRLPRPARRRLVTAVAEADLERLVAAVAPALAPTLCADVALLQALLAAAGAATGDVGRSAWQGLLEGVLHAPETVQQLWAATLAGAAMAAGLATWQVAAAVERVAPALRGAARGLAPVVAAPAFPSLEPAPVVVAPVLQAPVVARDLNGHLPRLDGLPEGGVAVSNAGLVLLSPFLVRFLDRLGLLDDRRTFRDERCRSRAMALLGHLATGRDPVEHQLPLVKVLCGAEPAALFEPGPPVTPEEADEARLLLAAPSAHAQALGELSVEALRAAFLQRDGVLSESYDAWMLRVGPDAVDIMLDQLPWSFGWTRLPWMPVPLTVEWGGL
jgi:hypothetical protein